MAGADPTDPVTFAPAAVPRLRTAVHELSVLLGFGYAEVAASTLVGDQHQLAGGAILRGRDGALRDVPSVHGSWRRGDSTARAIEVLAEALGDTDLVWVLDAPVSNSGRLAVVLRERWPVELADNAGRRLLEFARDGRWLATSDSVLLDGAAGWVAPCEAAGGWIVDLGGR